jgi:phosphorylcholine metabolism protein LicD
MTLAQTVLKIKEPYINFDFEAHHRGMKYKNIDICVRNLLDAKTILDSFNIPFFLMYGTLLGAVRDNGFIENAKDTDLGLFVESKEPFPAVINIFRNQGFMLIRTACNDNIVSVFRDGEYIDFVFYKHENLSFKNLINFDFLDTKFLIPEDYEKLLTELYGDWRTPVLNCHATKFYGIDEL